MKVTTKPVKKVKAKVNPLKKSVVKPKAVKPKKYQQGGVVTSQDVLSMAVGRMPANMTYDFNGDGRITSADALVLAKKEAATKKQQSQMAEAQREAQRQQIAAQQKASQTPNEMYRQSAAPAPTRTPAPTAPAPRIKLSQRLQTAQNATRAKIAGPASTVSMSMPKVEKKITNNEPALVRIRADEERRQQAANKPRGAYKGALITKKVASKKAAIKKVTPKKK